MKNEKTEVGVPAGREEVGASNLYFFVRSFIIYLFFFVRFFIFICVVFLYIKITCNKGGTMGNT